MAAVGKLKKKKEIKKEPKPRKAPVKKVKKPASVVKTTPLKKNIVKKPRKIKEVVEEIAEDVPEVDDYISEEVKFSDIENLTVRQVVERHGGIAGFKLYIDALRGMAD